MRRLAAIILIIVSVVAFGSAPSYSDAGTSERPVKTIHGDVSSVDWVSGTFGIKWLDIEYDVYQEMSFTVPDGFKIRKGPNTMDLSELEIGDPLIVNYYANPDGSAELIDINDSASFGEEF